MNIKKLGLLVLIVVGIAAFFSLEGQSFLTLDNLKSQQEAFALFYSENQLLTLVLFGLFYIGVTALSLPGAAVMTLAAGALFGFLNGLILVSFASTIGATLAFLMARFIARDWVSTRYESVIEKVNAGIKKDGIFYLLTLRLIPLFPFFLVNIVMGLTRISTLRYFIVSQIGMLPGTAAYVYAGLQLSQINTLEDVLSTELIGAFILLGLLPWVGKGMSGVLRWIQQEFKFKKPSKYDYNTIVIGAGSGGLVASYLTAAAQAKVALIEKHKMGGDCLNTGCVPSKTLIKSAKIMAQAKRAKDFGFKKTTIDFTFSDIMARIQKVIKTIEPHDSVERYTQLGVTCFQGEAKILDPYRVRVKSKTLSTKNIIVATGARPFVPPIKGLEEVPFYTSDTLWSLKKQPKRLLILGGGPIGCEMAQAFQRLGTQVIQVERGSEILGREDSDVVNFTLKKFKQEGVEVKLNHEALEFGKDKSGPFLICEHKKKKVKIRFDSALIAIGRRANVTGFGLEKLGVELRENGTIDANPYLQTNYKNIFVCGDVTGPYQFTHTASHQAWYASVNALFRPFKKFKADYRVIPWATFVDPEIARVGLNEKEAQSKKIEYETSLYDLKALDRAITAHENEGFIKVLTRPGKDEILGVTIVGSRAGDLIHEFTLAMKYNLGLSKILGTVHAYPTFSEANKNTAGIWRKNHIPKFGLKILKLFHAWRRG